ncbi:MAG: hypothetical protein ABEK59_01365 [Halobacteria archaeon]
MTETDFESTPAVEALRREKDELTQEAIAWFGERHDGGDEKALEYIEEAVHAEGTGYFREHNDLGRVKDDYALFVFIAAGGCDECDNESWAHFDDDEKLRCDNCEEVQPHAV